MEWLDPIGQFAFAQWELGSARITTSGGVFGDREIALQRWMLGIYRIIHLSVGSPSQWYPERSPTLYILAYLRSTLVHSSLLTYHWLQHNRQQLFRLPSYQLAIRIAIVLRIHNTHDGVGRLPRACYEV